MRMHWNHYFLAIAEQVASRSTCDRKHVGCVLVRERRILATGYNGSLCGSPHCDDAGHDLVESQMSDGTWGSNCVRTVHAEQNAIAQAASEGIAIKNAWAYVNAYPCWNCYKLLVNAGVNRIICSGSYRLDPRVDAARFPLPMVESPGCYYCGEIILADSEDFGRPLCFEHFQGREDDQDFVRAIEIDTEKTLAGILPASTGSDRTLAQIVVASYAKVR